MNLNLPRQPKMNKGVANLVTRRDIADSTTSDTKGLMDFVQIDDSLVVHLLSLSYEQRIDAHELARELVHDLTQAGKDYYARQSKGTT